MRVERQLGCCKGLELQMSQIEEWLLGNCSRSHSHIQRESRTHQPTSSLKFAEAAFVNEVPPVRHALPTIALPQSKPPRSTLTAFACW